MPIVGLQTEVGALQVTAFLQLSQCYSRTPFNFLLLLVNVFYRCGMGKKARKKNAEPILMSNPALKRVNFIFERHKEKMAVSSYLVCQLIYCILQGIINIVWGYMTRSDTSSLMLFKLKTKDVSPFLTEATRFYFTIADQMLSFASEK